MFKARVTTKKIFVSDFKFARYAILKIVTIERSRRLFDDINYHLSSVLTHFAHNMYKLSSGTKCTVF